MSVKVVAVTKPLLWVDNDSRQMNVNEFVAFVARVSNPSNQNNTLTANKLLRYLITHKHFSPFEMVDIVMEINTTRDIARQILRHRSFSFQEFSQRYADPTKDLGFVTREARLQDQSNRQNSIEVDDKELQEQWDLQQTLVLNAASKAYNLAIELGIAKEQARAVLPEGLTCSRLYMKGSLRSWLHYCQLRCANGTQKEHQEIAKLAWSEVVNIFTSMEGLINE